MLKYFDIEKLKQDINPKVKEFKEKIQETKKNIVPKVEEVKESATKATKIVKKKILSFSKIALITICAALLLFLGFCSSDGNNLYVISIGVPAYNYHENFEDIEASEHDAEKISKLFNKLSKSLFSKVEVKTLAEYGKATRKDILLTIDKVYKKAKENDVVLIYFSGHGEKIGNDYFLLPFDSEPEDIIETGVKAGRLIVKKNIRTIVWIDACYSGAAAKDLDRGNVNLLVSSSVDNQSYCNINGSDFTNKILKGLEYCRADYDKNGIVDLQELARYVGKGKNPIKRLENLDLVRCVK